MVLMAYIQQEMPVFQRRIGT